MDGADGRGARFGRSWGGGSGCRDGTGPAVGARVVALTSGVFAERVAIDAGALAHVPKGLALAKAGALPVAGVAALRSLRAAGLGPDQGVGHRRLRRGRPVRHPGGGAGRCPGR